MLTAKLAEFCQDSKSNLYGVLTSELKLTREPGRPGFPLEQRSNPRVILVTKLDVLVKVFFLFVF